MTRIGRYEILEELGRGGFATVFKARDSQLNRLVALKVLHAGWSSDPDFVSRFQQEAETVASFRHTNIVVIHDIGEIDRQLFIAMEYLPGENLQSWLAGKDGPLTIAETLPILRPIADALDYAHKQGVIHRDIKPSNIMIQDKNDALQVVLTDFGLVKAMENSVALTTRGHTLGSPEYMAPEQADPNRRDEFGPATDLYAFGIVAYQMLAGRVPFPGNSISTLNAHANLEVPSPQQFHEAVSDDVAAILLKMLAKSPADRYPSAAAFMEELLATTQTESQEEERLVHVAPLYTKLQQAQGEGDWVEVVSLAAQIETLLPGYRDVAQRQTTARQQLKKLQAARPTHKSAGPIRQASRPRTPPVRTLGSVKKHERTGLRKVPVYVWVILVTVVMCTGLFVLTRPEADLPEIGEVGRPISSEQPVKLQVGSNWTRPADDMVMVYVPAGRFMMGSDPDVDYQADNDEQPQHEVELDDFWIDQTEVTNTQYNRCVMVGECEPSSFENIEIDEGDFFMDEADMNGHDQPVVNVNWFDAETYCGWAGGALPTEAQWEYAARGPDNLLYPWGNEFDGNRLNFCDSNCTFEWTDDSFDDGMEFAAPVGTYPDGVSWVGAYDFAGNVFEWTADWYYEDYYADLANNAELPSSNPTGPKEGDFKTLRGGAWFLGAEYTRPANRNLDGDSEANPSIRSPVAGFRCAAPGSFYGKTTLSSTPSVIVRPTATPIPSSPPADPTLGSMWKRPADEMVMVYVPAGRFMMGSNPAVDLQAEDDEQPQHEVIVDGFWIDQTEVTNAQYNRCTIAGKCEPPDNFDELDEFDEEAIGRKDQPVVGVSWFDAEAYCGWVSGGIPTEAQWEYAARGPDNLLYPWGNEFDGNLLNFCDSNCTFQWKDDSYDDGIEMTAPVGTYPNGASWVGAYDFAGNVFEWTADWYSEDYYAKFAGLPSSNPTGPMDGDFKVVRGGAWVALAGYARSADRNTYAFVDAFPESRTPIVGFRCAVSSP